MSIKVIGEVPVVTMEKQKRRDYWCCFADESDEDGHSVEAYDHVEAAVYYFDEYQPRGSGETNTVCVQTQDRDYNEWSGWKMGEVISVKVERKTVGTVLK